MESGKEILLSKENSKEKANYRTLLLLGVIFMFITAAFVSTQNLIISIYSKIGLEVLGSLSIFFLYSGLIIGGFFTPYIVSRLSLKKSLYIFSYSYVAIVTAGCLTSLCNGSDLSYCKKPILYAINIGAMLFCGLFCGNCLLAGASYVDAISEPHNKSKFYGTFFSLQLSAQIVGNLLATLLIGLFSEAIFFFVMLILAIVSSNCFLFLPSVSKAIPESEETGDSPEIVVPQISTTAIKVLQQFKCPLMKKVMVICLNNGMLDGAYISFLYKVVNTGLDQNLSDHDKNFYTALVFIILGCGSILGGYISGKLGDSYDVLFINEMAVLFGEAALVMMVIAFLQRNYIIACISGGLFGLADTSGQSGINVLISKEKPLLECFSFFRMNQGLGIIAAALIAYFIKDEDTYYIFFLVIFAFQLFTSLVIGTMQVQKKKEKFFE